RPDPATGALSGGAGFVVDLSMRRGAQSHLATLAPSGTLRSGTGRNIGRIRRSGDEIFTRPAERSARTRTGGAGGSGAGRVAFNSARSGHAARISGIVIRGNRHSHRSGCERREGASLSGAPGAGETARAIFESGNSASRLKPPEEGPMSCQEIISQLG